MYVNMYTYIYIYIHIFVYNATMHADPVKSKVYRKQKYICKYGHTHTFEYKCIYSHLNNQ
jgi:hypothetical protein